MFSIFTSEIHCENIIISNSTGTTNYDNRLTDCSKLRIIRNEKITRFNVVSGGDSWIHFEGQIYNPYERGFNNITITYPQFEGVSPVKIAFLREKKTIKYKSSSYATSHGGQATPLKPLVKIRNFNPGDELITEIKCE